MRHLARCCPPCFRTTVAYGLASAAAVALVGLAVLALVFGLHLVVAWLIALVVHRLVPSVSVRHATAVLLVCTLLISGLTSGVSAALRKSQ